MSSAQRRVAVIGAGLVGGSIARALHGRPEVDVTVYDRDPATRARVRAAGIDVAESASQCVHGAHLTVLAVPPSQLGQVAMDVRRVLPRDAIVLETGCVKRELPTVINVMNRARPDVRVVTSNPVVGGAHGGFEHADPNLFSDVTWIIGGAGEDPQALAEVGAFVRALGVPRTRIDLSPDDHDRIVGAVQLAPHLLVPVMTTFFAGPDGAAPIRPALFQQTLRLSTSPAPLWSEVLTAGSPRVAPVLERLHSHLETLIFAIGSRTEIQEYATLVTCLRERVTARYGNGVILPVDDPELDHQVRVAEMLAYGFVRAAADVAAPGRYRIHMLFDVAGPAFADVTALAYQGMSNLVAAANPPDASAMAHYRRAVEDAQRIVSEARLVLSDLRTTPSSDFVVFGVNDDTAAVSRPVVPSLDACFRAAQRAYAQAARQTPELLR